MQHFSYIWKRTLSQVPTAKIGFLREFTVWHFAVRPAGYAHEKAARSRPRTRWRDWISDLARPRTSKTAGDCYWPWGTSNPMVAVPATPPRGKAGMKMTEWIFKNIHKLFFAYLFEFFSRKVFVTDFCSLLRQRSVSHWNFQTNYVVNYVVCWLLKCSFYLIFRCCMFILCNFLSNFFEKKFHCFTEFVN